MKNRVYKGSALIAAALLMFAAGAFAKDYPDWEGYPPMFAMNGVVGYKGAVYGMGKGGIFRYDPETRTYTQFYRNHGLPATDAKCAAVVGTFIYFGFMEEGLFRFDPETGVFDPVTFPEYTPNRIGLNSLYAPNDSILFVGHTKGIDILNLRSREVRTITKLGNLAQDTWVNDVKAFKGKIWACTAVGLAVADEGNPNLDLESSWKSYVYTPFGQAVGFNCILYIKDQYEEMIYLGTQGKGIVWYDEKNGVFWESAVTEDKIYSMSQGNGRVWAAGQWGLYSKYVRYWSLMDDKYKNLSGVWGEEKRVWVSSLTDGLQCMADAGWAAIAPVPGPRSTKFLKIGITAGNVVWATTPFYRGRRQEEEFMFLHRLQNGVWTTYGQSDGFLTSPVSLALDRNDTVWLSLYGWNKSGVFVIKDDGTADKKKDVITPVDPEKTIFRSTIAQGYVVCTDVTTDKHGNLWISNFQLDQPDADEGGRSHTLEPIPSSGAVVVDGFPIKKSRHFSPASGDIPTAKIYDICADQDGWVWMGTERKGLMAIKVGDDPFDTTKPTVHRVLEIADGLNSLRVTAIKNDRDGNVWVGTDAGLNLVTKFPDDRLKVDQVTNLLGTAGTLVYCIEADRFNNKWIGTSNGLVKVNAQNETGEVFTTKNSGLFSNSIYGLTYDEKTDVLWVGTDSGLNTFRILGSAAADTTRTARMYPNPFSLWGTDSRCTFSDVKIGTKVRIYSFNGILVNELEVKDTSAKGVPYTRWNGRNFKNEWVASGVYFFTGEDQNGRPFRDKMMLIRR